MIGPIGSLWTSSIQLGYTFPTTFIVPSDGYYLLTYKLDIRSGGGIPPTTSTDCGSVITQNGISIPGSSTIVEAPESNHIYTISNTVLCLLTINDKLELLFWSSDPGTRIGDPTFLKGTLPSGASAPQEATASIVFTKITSI